MTLMATTRRSAATRQTFPASWALLSLLVLLLLPSFAQTAAAKSSSDSAGSSSSSTKGAFQKVSRLSVYVCVYVVGVRSVRV